MWNVAGTVFHSVTRRASPKLHLLVSYLLEDEFSFFSLCWSNIWHNHFLLQSKNQGWATHALLVLLSLFSRYRYLFKCHIKIEKWAYINPASQGMLLLNNREISGHSAQDFTGYAHVFIEVPLFSEISPALKSSWLHGLKNYWFMFNINLNNSWTINIICVS